MRWFLHQKHLLNYIAASENLGATLFDEKTGEPVDRSNDPEIEGDIRFHVFMVPSEEWIIPANVDRSANLTEDRKKQIVKRCLHQTQNVGDSDQNNRVVSDSLKCKEDKGQDQQPCEDCHRILLEMPDGKPAQMNDEHDVLLAIPGGLVGYHAFYVILENIIRNAAKHGYVRHKNEIHHLDIIIEILYDPEEKIRIQNGEKILPAYLLRIYDNVSRVAWSEEMRKNGEGVKLWGKNSMNEKLATSIIDETGQLRKEDWGLAEMKIAAGYLQRREILHIGGEKDKIVGSQGDQKKENELDNQMLIQGSPEDPKSGAGAIIRAVESPIGTLGYELFIPKPRMIGIVCGRKEGSYEPL